MSKINLKLHPPSDVLIKYQVDVSSDPHFRSWCRLKQSVYRTGKGWNCGMGGGGNKNGKKKIRKIGNFLTPADGESGKNFLNESIYKASMDRLKPENREYKDLIGKNRLLQNMLTSQTLCFNLFIPQARDPALKTATKIWATVLPNSVKQVTQVKLEHSPGRRDPIFGLGDHSAFDAFLQYEHVDGSRGVIAIETKYTDSFSSASKQEMSVGQKKTVNGSGLYSSKWEDLMEEMGTQQLHRTHVLAETFRSDQCRHVTYMVLYVDGDTECEKVLPLYRESLSERTKTSGEFVALTLRTFHEDVRPVLNGSDGKWLHTFHERYLDWSPVEAVL